MNQPEKKTEDFLISLTKNCETLVKQTLTKTQGRLEFKNTKSREIFSSKPSFNPGLDASWMVGLKI